MKNFNKLQELINIVKISIDSEKGCNWLKNKKFKDIVSYTLEESYELAASVDERDDIGICAELGDLLFHVLLYAAIAEKEEVFTLTDVIESAIIKQKQRKNFNKMVELSAEEANQYWQQQKLKEIRDKNSNIGLLDDIPKALPAILRSKKIQDRAALVGFDYSNVQEVLDKLKEEIAELENGIANNDANEIQHELGDVLLSAVNVARHLQQDPEQALQLSTNKFYNRFKYIEDKIKKSGKEFSDYSFEQMLQYWEEAKRYTDSS